MKRSDLLHRCAPPAILALAVLTACDGPATPSPLAPADEPAFGLTEGNAEVGSWLAGLRNATAAFHEIGVASDAGWNAPITACMELPGTGGMGYHYGNPGLIDGTAEEFAPELLVYEPQKNGRLRLVAVEYIIPFAAWSDPTPPSLHGVQFQPNQAFGLWALHAWVWKNNPAGIFADWNPNVSCAWAN